VHIYVDAVINHITKEGVQAGTSSTCVSYFNPQTREFSGVPISGLDFNDGNCRRGSEAIENYNDPAQLRDCLMTYLLVLATGKDYVRTKVADYMNHLIDIGVAGFRIDAAKHMWPGDIQAILDKLHNLNTKWFSQGSRPSTIQEVVDLGGDVFKNSEYFGTVLVTEFKYGISLGTVICKWNGEKMAYLR
ncbi:hypothetical protein U0070_020591, partial [Myodes glareolus]